MILPNSSIQVSGDLRSLSFMRSIVFGWRFEWSHMMND